MGWGLLIFAPMVISPAQNAGSCLWARCIFGAVTGNRYFVVSRPRDDIFHSLLRVGSDHSFYDCPRSSPGIYYSRKSLSLSVAFDHIAKGFSGYIAVLATNRGDFCWNCFSLPYFFLFPAQSEYSDYYMELRHVPQSFVMFDFPSRRDNSNLLPTEFFFYQSIHYRPIPMRLWMHGSTNEFWGELTRVQQSGGMRDSPVTGVAKRSAKKTIPRRISIFSAKN